MFGKKPVTGARQGLPPHLDEEIAIIIDAIAKAALLDDRKKPNSTSQTLDYEGFGGGKRRVYYKVENNRGVDTLTHKICHPLSFFANGTSPLGSNYVYVDKDRFEDRMEKLQEEQKNSEKH